VPGFPRLQQEYDFVILGGGHAGLTAALKAALLEYTALVVDRGPKYSRSYYAPKMDNIPGFPDGISGHRLLDLQIAALKPVEDRVTYVTPATVTALTHEGDGRYRVDFDWLKNSHHAEGRAAILAMGVVDRIPTVQGKIDPIFPWANQAIVDFCVLCDGHELPGKSVAVIGDDAFAARTALELLHFKPRTVELLTHGNPLLGGMGEPERSVLVQALNAAQIPTTTLEIVGFDGIREKQLHVKFADGSLRKFDRGFCALPWYDQHQAIPRSLGARIDAEGYVATDGDSRVLADVDGSVIAGLYCVGDQKSGWNQIPEAWASAERAVIHAYAEYL
jgi:thioredoxin reductase (NADPH)